MISALGFKATVVNFKKKTKQKKKETERKPLDLDLFNEQGKKFASICNLWNCLALANITNKTFFANISIITKKNQPDQLMTKYLVDLSCFHSFVQANISSLHINNTTKWILTSILLCYPIWISTKYKINVDIIDKIKEFFKKCSKVEKLHHQISLGFSVMKLRYVDADTGWAIRLVLKNIV